MKTHEFFEGGDLELEPYLKEAISFAFTWTDCYGVGRDLGSSHVGAHSKRWSLELQASLKCRLAPGVYCWVL